MAYNILLKIENGCLRYFVSGKRSIDSAVKFWQRIYKDCEQHKIFRIHVTLLLSGQIDKMEIPLLINRLIELNAKRSITCAWVDHNPQSFHDNKIGERIPRPDCMNIKIFDCDTLASKWLLEDSMNNNHLRDFISN